MNGKEMAGAGRSSVAVGNRRPAVRVVSLCAIVAMVAGLLIAGGMSPAHAAPPERIRDTPTGEVNAVAVDGGVTYAVGSFTTVGAATGAGALVDSSTGTVNRRFPTVDNGTVLAFAADGLGGFYVGGNFSSLNGVVRNRLAHVLADGTLDPVWNPNASGTVNALAVSGGTVYVGGEFNGANSINGTTTRNYAAAVDATTGTVTGWNPNANNRVSAVAVSGSTVYLGGFFNGANSINGTTTRNYAAAVDSTTGTVTGWNPNANNRVSAVAVSGGTVYLGGLFNGANSINGTTLRNYAAAVDSTTGTVTGWNPNASATVHAVAVAGGAIYLGGAFNGANSINGTTLRNYAAAVDSTTGTVTSWNPNASSAVNALAVAGSTVYLGGEFTTVNGITRNRAASVDATTGTVTAWDPNANSIVYAVAVSGSTVYLGGFFVQVNLVTRNRAAAFDSDGRVTSWNPNSTGPVLAVAVSGGTVYLGGQFTTVNGATRNRAAAVDATTGTVTGWNPNANNPVSALAVSGSTVYLGGSFNGFNSINGTTTRNRAAAVDATTGTVTGWNPNANNSVSALAVSGGTVYLGGQFTTVNGATRNRAAAVDATIGTVTAWNPNANNRVSALAVSGSTVYLGGFFNGANSINGTTTRNRAAAVDATTGTVTAWNPNATNAVRALAVSGSTVYLGGDFTGANSINGTTLRNRAAAVNATTGTVTNWNPNANNIVYALAVSGSTVYLGGAFTTVAENVTQPGSSALAAAAPSGARSTQVLNPGVSGSLMTWTPPWTGGIASYYVMYRPLGSAQPWAIYAAGANNTGVSLTNPGTPGACSAANTAMGWTSCPMVRGWHSGTTYQFAVYPKTTMATTVPGPLAVQITHLAP